MIIDSNLVDAMAMAEKWRAEAEKLLSLLESSTDTARRAVHEAERLKRENADLHAARRRAEDLAEEYCADSASMQREIADLRAKVHTLTEPDRMIAEAAAGRAAVAKEPSDE